VVEARDHIVRVEVLYRLDVGLCGHAVYGMCRWDDERLEEGWKAFL